LIPISLVKNPSAVYLLAAQQINELGRARFYRASAFLLGRNDRIA
jgi:hypothetical protein